MLVPPMPTFVFVELPPPCCSYEDYLSSFVTEADLKYLQDAEAARRIVELG